MEEWRYSFIILDVGTRWRWVVSFTPQLLYPRGKSPQYPLDKRLGGPQSRSRFCRMEKIFFPLLGIEPSRPARSQSLYQLSYLGSLLICSWIPNFKLRFQKIGVDGHSTLLYSVKVWLRFPETRRIKCWRFANVSANISVVIFVVNVFGKIIDLTVYGQLYVKPWLDKSSEWVANQ
jgi:hypothetical protein